MIFIDFHGFRWIFMMFHGLRWIFMIFHGFPWISMDFHGNPWIFMDKPVPRRANRGGPVLGPGSCEVIFDVMSG